jgi:hypothetical protein
MEPNSSHHGSFACRANHLVVKTVLRYMSLSKSLSILTTALVLTSPRLFGQPHYQHYHRQVIVAEQLIAGHRFEEALSAFDVIFESYDFVFVRDYKVATQLALTINDKARAHAYLRLAMQAGWGGRQARKNKLIRPLLKELSKKEADSLSKRHEKTIDDSLRAQVRAMYKADQKMALKALFKLGQKAKIRYNEEQFAPHSEKQLANVIEVLHSHGYPGKRLIGNDFWMSTILSHHNSISSAYNKSDTLYRHIRPTLLAAIDKGQMSPFEFALIENWKAASESNHGEVSYGYLGPALDSLTVETADSLRRQIGLRSIALRNALVDIATETGIDFYLPGSPWQHGKIVVTSPQ